jgi:hypothetical protein
MRSIPRHSEDFRPLIVLAAPMMHHDHAFLDL